jgi:AcrR family transcriptional regulator
MSAVRERIVEAVDELVRSRGWDATRMADVAAAAGVSRQTVYNEFRNRDELVQAYVLREIEALIASVEVHVRANSDDARQALSGAFGLFLKLASDEPVVRIIVADAAGDEVIRLLTATGLAVATERVGALIVEVWPQVPATDARLLAETLARLAISHALSPTTSPDETAAAVTRMLGPFVDEVLLPDAG